MRTPVMVVLGGGMILVNVMLTKCVPVVVVPTDVFVVPGPKLLEPPHRPHCSSRRHHHRRRRIGHPHPHRHRRLGR
jgi:hypothetical protein